MGNIPAYMLTHKETKMPDNNLYYLDIAKYMSTFSRCLNKHWGAIIVNTNGDIIATGFNSVPAGRIQCDTIGSCYRVTHNIQRGTRYETCRSNHAELSAIMAVDPVARVHSTMYLYGYDAVKKAPVENPSPCTLCRRAIIDSGISRVIVPSHNEYGYNIIDVSYWHTNDETLTDNVGY